MAGTIKRYAEFWPFYLQEHSNPTNRMLHYIGTTLVFVALAAAIWTRNWWLLLLMPVAGYFFAWVGHFGVQKNRPATFTYPFWSLVSDFRMYFTWLGGKIDRELKKYQVRQS